MRLAKKRRYKREPLKIISELNMTPMIDVTFLLLIAFIVTYPLLENSANIILPRATTNKIDPDKAKPLNLAIDATGKIFLDKQEVSIEALEASLAQLVHEDPQTAVMIRGDEMLNYGELMKVVAVLNKVKVTRMALVSHAEGGK